MRVLLSGASSFTGYWFCRQLLERGHQVQALLQRESLESYSGTRKARVEKLHSLTECSFSISFGSESFCELVRSDGWDIYCHHGFRVENYRSDDFDVLAAVADNTRNLKSTLKILKSSGCERILFTGSVFEAGEGLGGEGLPNITYYGLSKSLAWQIFSHEASLQDFCLGKFVIPNPFGPLEEKRFTHYLMSRWEAGEPAEVRTPDYVRDNIHVDLLALDYAEFLETMPSESGVWTRNPSGFVASQGVFTQHLAEQVRRRTAWPCEVKLPKQADFPEPRIRINSEPALARHSSWSEEKAFDAFVNYYLNRG